MNGLLAFAKWLQNTSPALWLASSTWAYPFAQATHFTGLSLWVGTNVLLDLRLMGVGSKRESSADMRDALLTWNWIGLCIAILGGFSLFSTAASTYAVNPAFRLKLGMLIPTALLLHIIVQWKAREWGQTAEPPPIAKIAGLVEMLLWIGVISAAVSIPFFD
jgi:hypothetical protein